jgi:hypothetical protein
MPSRYNALVMASPISGDDVGRWVERGIITAEQRDAILQDLAARGATGGGLNLTTLLYYGGGLLVLVAYTVFLGLQWMDMNEIARIVISGVSLLFFAVVAQVLLQDRRFQLPGELLQVVAVAIIPLFVFALLDAAGVWPHDPSRYDYQPQYYRPVADALRRQYQIDLTWARMGLAGATMAGALLAFRLSRSPFVLIAALIALGSLIVDASIQIQGGNLVYDLGTGQTLIIAAMGASVLVAGIGLRDHTERDYSTWLFISGLAAVAIGLASRTFPSDAATAWGAVWMICAITVLALSIPLQQRLFAAAGLAAIFAYLGKLVFDVFNSDATAALAMALLGLIVLGGGLLYQRFIAPRVAPPA